MKGVILNYDAVSKTGVISAENGERYTLRGERWQSVNVTPYAGLYVDFMVAGSSAIEVYVDATRQPTVNEASRDVNQVVNDLQASTNHGIGVVKDKFNQLPIVQQQNGKSEVQYNMLDWFIKCLKNYANFKGRARRKEFGYFNLCAFITLFAVRLSASILGFMLSSMFMWVLYWLVLLLLFIPALSVSTRRLHDLGHSGWVQLLFFIPLINFGLMIYLLFADSKPEANQYGAPVK